MRAATKPIRIREGVANEVLQKLSAGDLGYNELWLQELIAAHPEVLPVSEIEPAFERLISAGREIACGHGYIDNLFLTGGGDIVLVETKLHANSQARREVVAQTLDYVAALSAMTFEKFEAAVCAAQHGRDRPASLHALIKGEPEALDECAFSDAVSANLSRGRMLALVVGDGIRREAETLASVLQSHAGSYFTFALVELAIYRGGDGDLFVVPSTLAKTLMIERAVVRISPASAPIIVEALPPKSQSASLAPRGISEVQFDELMNQRKPGLSSSIREFLSSLEPLGVYSEMKASLNLKANAGGDKPINLGYIQKNGQLWTNAATWNISEQASREYLDRLARAIQGTVVEATPGMSAYVSTNGKSAPYIEKLLPDHANEWRSAVEELLRSARALSIPQ